jgi:hypothetical protein
MNVYLKSKHKTNMSKLNLPPFYVGQEVIGVIPNEKGFPKKGVEYKVLAIKKELCCGLLTIYVGYKTQYTITRCFCGCERPNYDFYSAHRFAPLQEAQAPLLTFEQIKQTEKEEILILN